MSDEVANNPNCPTCLHLLQAAGSVERPYWACQECGYVALSH